MRVQQCSLCSLQGMTHAKCPECKGFGEYWVYEKGRYSYGFKPSDAVNAGGAGNIRGNLPSVRKVDVERARKLASDGWTNEEIARHLGLYITQVRRVTLGCRNKVMRPINLSDEDVADINAARGQGALWKDLAKLYGTTPSGLNEYITRKNLGR